MHSVECPFCGVLHVPNRYGEVHLAGDPFGWPGVEVVAQVAICINCERPYLIVITRQTGEVVDYEPKVTPHTSALHGVPKDVLDDLHEGERARGYGLHKGAVMLFRRAVQGSCYDKKAPDVRLL